MAGLPLDDHENSRKIARREYLGSDELRVFGSQVREIWGRNEIQLQDDAVSKISEPCPFSLALTLSRDTITLAQESQTRSGPSDNPIISRLQIYLY